MRRQRCRLGSSELRTEHTPPLRTHFVPNNRLDTQTFGQYGVCDFDGDGIDDLFLATGVYWWFSGMGEFSWRFLALRNERLQQLRFGYFDADQKCDVVTESNNAWMISSGGTGQWYRLSQGMRR